MKRTLFILITALLISSACQRAKLPEAPDVEKSPVELVNHDNKRIDNYYWMMLTDEQKNAESPDDQTKKVLDYMAAENDYTATVMKHTEPLQEKIYQELTSRIRKDDSSVPLFEDGYYSYVKYESEKEYPVYYRKKGSLDAPEEMLLDVNLLADGKPYCSVSGVNVSPDGTILSYGVDYVSRRRYTLNFVDLTTGEPLAETIENTTGSVTWANDSKTFFYVEKDWQTLRSARVKRHKLGDTAEKDKVVFFEADETFAVNVGKSTSDRYILINSTQTLTTETRFIDASKPDMEPKVFTPRMLNHEYEVDHLNGKFYILTNSNNSLNFRLMTAEEGAAEIDSWTEIIPHRSDVLLQGFVLFDNFLVINERSNALNQIRVINETDKSEHYLDFGEEVYSARPAGNPEHATTKLRYSYSSLTTPGSVIDYDMVTKEKVVLKEDFAGEGFDKTLYEAKRVWATADDGTKIPVSLVYRKGLKTNGKAPLLLYAYGSYGNSTDASFRSSVFSLVDRGFVYAIAHIRGGSDMGRQWYEDGKLLKKINTFTDFNDCAHFLIDEHYTSTDRLFANGGSAGGLLMGAIVNMEPNLYRGVIAGVPFVDVVTTMLDASIPLTTFEWDEWGDPREKVYYDYMLSYSPYDQVKEQDYPNMLVTTGFWDSQVQYWEPLKWVAKLRDMKTDDNILLLYADMTAGHGGSSGRFARLKRTAMEYAFMLDLAGKKE